MGNKHSVDFKTGRKSRGIGLSLDTSYKAPKGSETRPPSHRSRSIEDMRADPVTARRTTSVQSLHETSDTNYRRPQTNTQTPQHPRPKTVAGDVANRSSTIIRQTSVSAQQMPVPSRQTSVSSQQTSVSSQQTSVSSQQASINDATDSKPKNGERFTPANNDLNKVFRENGKKGRVSLNDVDENLNETDLLDKKLETLKRQKNGNVAVTMETSSNPNANGIVDFATVASVATAAKKRVRKSKPAPRPNTMQPQTTHLKKKVAPKPPNQSTRPVTSLENINNNSNHDITEDKISVSIVSQVETVPVEPMSSPRDALMKDLQRTLSNQSVKEAAVIEDQSRIQATMEFDSRQLESKTKAVTDGVGPMKEINHTKITFNKELSQKDDRLVEETTAHDWLVKNSYTHPLATDMEKIKTVVIERELTSKSSRKVKKRPDTPTDPIPQEIAAALEEMSEETCQGKTTSTEIGTQADASVDMGVQCSGATLKARKSEDEKEKLENVLKLFIDKNAEEEASRSADPSPDNDLQDAPLKQAVQLSHEDKKVEIQENSMIVRHMDADIDLDSEAEAAAAGQLITASVKEDITLHRAIVVQTSADNVSGTSTLNKLEKSDSGVVVKVENEVESPRNDVQSSPVSAEQDSGHEDSSTSPVSLNSDNGAIEGKRNKSKKKFGKITKSMKSMKNFVSTSLKSGAKKNGKGEGSSEDADDDEPHIDHNWTLSRTKKNDNPTWYKDAYKQSLDSNASTIKEARERTPVKRHSSNIALLSPKGWDGNAVQSKTYRPVTMNFSPKSTATGISADDLY